MSANIIIRCIYQHCLNCRRKTIVWHAFSTHFMEVVNCPDFERTVPLYWQMSRILLNHGNVPSFHKNATQMYARNLNAVPASPQGKCNLGTSVRFPVKIASRDITSIVVVHSWKRVNLLPTKSFWRNKNAFSRAVCPSKNAEGLQVCVP